MIENIKNKYVKRAKITEIQFRKMIRYFVADMSATQIAEKISLNRNTVNRYLNELRERMAEFGERFAPFKSELIVDNQNNSRHAFSDKLVDNIGFLKRRGKVYSNMLTNVVPNKLYKFIKDKTSSNDVIIHAVDIKESYGMVAIGYDNNTQNITDQSYVDDLNKYWDFVKKRIAKFQGIAKHKMYVHMKECEFRFNFRNDDLYDVILKMLATKPLN